MDVGATNGWRMDEVLPSAEVIARCAPSCRWCSWSPQQPRRNRRALGLCRCQRPARPGAGRDRRHQQRDPGLLPRLQPRPPVHRGQAVPVPVRHPGYDLRSLLRGGASDADISRAIAAIWQQRTTATPSCAARWRPTAAGRAPRRDELHRRSNMMGPHGRLSADAWLRCPQGGAPPGGGPAAGGLDPRRSTVREPNSRNEAPMIDTHRHHRLVLAGGRGSRMGGVDKGLQNFQRHAAGAAHADAVADAGPPPRAAR
jgi:hypothetical protein